MGQKWRLAKAWERVRRLRRRFEKDQPWVVFPPAVKHDKGEGQGGDDADEESVDCHPVSTAALALNAQAVYCIIDTYGPNPVHIEPLQKQAILFLRWV